MKKSESVVLKVQINCNCCARKVKKAIGQVEGVESITVDLTQKKVTVTGSFDSSKVVKQIAKKTGKNVELAGAKDSSGAARGSDHKAVGGGGNKVKSSGQQEQRESATTFPVGDSFFFSDDNPNGCSIM
ncbi:copper transport protein ATX1 [Selaginella moellendorffii]|uniref:copper transport protein ATX1 n=1 Tax=Selaginella moellendorffii TaxID=88036 RepID=UPI000D1CBDB1|nr:copper transport protein ATX1 [Selaginella moellendorffii]|eukprot:XP_002992925.2 copper transport protein ATX1 [Selaginella moellendorffii]